MIITESRLRKIVLEEVQHRLVEELVIEELFKFLVEQDDELSDEEYIELWKKKPSFREKVRDAFNNFDAMSSLKKKMAIVALGMLGAAGTQFTADYAAQTQAREIASQLRTDKASAEAERFGSAADWKEFRAAAHSRGETVDTSDVGAWEKTKDQFVSRGIKVAPIIADAGIGMQMGTQKFAYTPADKISPDEVLPLFGMTKRDFEKQIRNWLTDPDGRDMIEKYIGTQGKGNAIFWATGPQEKLFMTIDTPDGESALWLPPEWSVAYDVVQKNKARAGNLKENFRKYLHYILEVL